jgi:hypothetical protein
MKTLISSRPPLAARRFGYALDAVINLAVVYAVDVWPGWWEVPVLTDDTTRVLGLFTASLVVGAFCNVVYLVVDTPIVRSLGETVTATLGIAVLIRLWRVFPFDFSMYEFPWQAVARALLMLAVVGAMVGLLINVVQLIRAASSHPHVHPVLGGHPHRR